MLMRDLGRWLFLLGLSTGACALAGYDFGEYEQEPPASGQNPEDSAGGAPSPAGIGVDDPIGVSGPIVPVAPYAAPYGASGDGGEHSSGTAPSDAAGAGAGGAATGEACPDCKPRGCLELDGQRCGVMDDGCGNTLDCGTCFWSFQECRQNLCQIRL